MNTMPRLKRIKTTKGNGRFSTTDGCAAVMTETDEDG